MHLDFIQMFLNEIYCSSDFVFFFLAYLKFFQVVVALFNLRIKHDWLINVFVRILSIK